VVSIEILHALVRVSCECEDVKLCEVFDLLFEVFGQDFTSEVVIFEADEPILAIPSVGFEEGLIIDFLVCAKHVEKFVEYLEPKVRKLEELLKKSGKGQIAEIKTFESLLKKTERRRI